MPGERLPLSTRSLDHVMMTIKFPVCVRMSFDVSAGQMLSCLQLAPQLSFRTPIAILYILGKLEKHTLRLIATNPS